MSEFKVMFKGQELDGVVSIERQYDEPMYTRSPGSRTRNRDVGRLIVTIEADSESIDALRAIKRNGDDPDGRVEVIDDPEWPDFSDEGWLDVDQSGRYDDGNYVFEFDGLEMSRSKE